jgi:hypothetical protein
MDNINELFKETNVLAEKFRRRNDRIRISSPPHRKTTKEKKSNQPFHRYGSEDRPPPLSEVSERDCENIPTAPERTPLAFCVKCGCDVPMKWKPRDKRGKDAASWFVCAVCGCDCLEIKMLPPEEAIEINRNKSYPEIPTGISQSEKNEEEKITISYARNSKHWAQKFIQENLIEEPGAFVISHELYESYEIFCRPNGYRILSMPAFFCLLKEIFPNAHRTRKRISSGHCRVWINIRKNWKGD